MVDFTLPAGMEDTMDQGDWVWWIWQGVCLLSGEKSTTLLGVPSCFGVMTMWLHHSMGSLTDTLSNSQSFSALSKPALTWSRQWRGI